MVLVSMKRKIRKNLRIAILFLVKSEYFVIKVCIFIIENIGNKYYQKENLKYAQSHYSHTMNKSVSTDNPTVSTSLISLISIFIFKNTWQFYVWNDISLLFWFKLCIWIINYFFPHPVSLLFMYIFTFWIACVHRPFLIKMFLF